MIQEFEPQLKRNTSRSHAISVCTQILVALRFYASGSFQNIVADSSGLSQQSVSKIITSVSNILAERARNEIKMPADILQLQQTMRDFHAIAGFPRVIGAIDGSHIPIKAPTEDEEIYVNRKKFHSINIQVVCDAQRVIINYDVKYPGSTHDAYIWNRSTLRTRFQHGEFRDGILLGDSGYPLEPSLMTPFANPASPAEEEFNRCHTRTRTIIEQTFGVLKSRFRCLHKSGGNLQYDPLKCAKITAACLLLHNRCIKRRICCKRKPR
ncbi:putative nuclease HARBI1 [Hyalella azteca]|uniref:Putative nuclease HARBI1 n=1 Tax=Hyalella azteca TaxID=294128 RepID=A0A8B7N2X2_HYAAZ|nr:putative nuclease HARBI1 [Hyalella azteca]